MPRDTISPDVGTIERCDECRRFSDDDAAADYVRSAHSSTPLSVRPVSVLADLASRLRSAFTSTPSSATELVAEATRRRVIDAAVELACGDLNDSQAFARLLEAVALHTACPRPQPAAPLAAVPFGPKKGQSLRSLTDAELERLERWLTTAVQNQAKAQFRAANLSLRAAVREEVRRRAI